MKNFKGVATIELRNKDTLELEYTDTQSNTLLSGIFDGLVLENQGFRVPIIYISDGNTPINQFNASTSILGSTFDLSGYIPTNQYYPQLENDTANSQYIITFMSRFDPGNSTRTINTIYINDTSSQFTLSSQRLGLKLNTPCMQSTSQILDIYYRFIINYSESDNSSDFNRNYLNTDAILSYFFGSATSSLGNGRLVDANSPTTPIFGSNTNSNIYSLANISMGISSSDFDINGIPFIPGNLYSQNLPPNGYGIGATNYDYNQGTKMYSFSFGLNDAIGTLIKDITLSVNSLYRGSPSSTWQNNVAYNGATQNSGIFSKSRLIKTTDSPIQSTYLKNTTSSTVYPYLDPSSIGSSTGIMTLNGAAWGNTNYPLMFKINISNSANGTLANTSYNYKVRMTGGFLNNNITTENTIPVYLYNYIDNARNSKKFYAKIAYDQISDTEIVSYANPISGQLTGAGITILNPLTNDYVSFDASSTPALVTNFISAISHDESGAIYIATTDKGLLKLSTDRTTLTQYTGIGANITDSQCYGVDINVNGDIFAAFTGGLAKLPNGSSTWTIYNNTTSPSFIYTGISDNLSYWSRIVDITINRYYTTDDQWLITALIGGSYQTISWGSALTTPVNFYNFNTAYIYNRYFKNSTKFLHGTTSIYSAYPNQGVTVTTFGSVRSSSNIPNIYTFSNSTDIYMTPILYNSSYVMDVTVRSLYGSPSSPSTGYKGYFDSNGTLVKAFNINNYGANGAIGVGTISTWPSVTVHEGYIKFYDYPTNDSSWLSYGWNSSTSQWELGNPGLKPMHTDYEALYDGITISFADAPSSSNFVNGEYWFSYVYDGLHKDNSTTLTFGTSLNTRDNYTTTDMLSNTIPSSALGTGTYPLNFYTKGTKSHKSYNGSAGIGLSNSTASSGLLSELSFSSDFDMEFVPTYNTTVSNGAYCIFSITDTPSSPVAKWGFYFPNNTGSYYIYEGNATVGGLLNFTQGDVFHIKRVGTTVTYLVNSTIVYTSTISSSSSVRGLISFNNETVRTFNDMQVTYNETRPILTIGSQGSQTGIFDPNYTMVEAWLTNPTTYSVTINGNPAVVWTDPSVTPGIGEVVLLQKNGWLIFNSADAGKTVTSSFQILKEV